MKTKDRILEFIKQKKHITGKELSSLLHISRQAIHRHMKELIRNGEVVKIGNTKGATYAPAGRIKPERKFGQMLTLTEVEEHTVLEKIVFSLNLGNNLKENVLDIFKYVFTEILNNAIEHSESTTCSIKVFHNPYECSFMIRDYGIGIFNSIRTKFSLPDENSAMAELLKGKTTTMKNKHSGEGVFFSSKSGDRVSFRSHKINIIFDNMANDIFVEDKKFIEGTEVKFTIPPSSKRNLQLIFNEYAPEVYDYKFEKTKIFVKLLQKKYGARSEARRLLSGLDKFREILLDFKGVKSIGQGFADEIFRVFKNTYPHIVISTVNLNPIIAQMIEHIVDNKL